MGIEFNQTVLAKLAGVSRTQLCEVLNGRRPMSRSMAVALGRVTGLEPGVLCFASPEALRDLLLESREKWAQASLCTR